MTTTTKTKKLLHFENLFSFPDQWSRATCFSASRTVAYLYQSARAYTVQIHRIQKLHCRNAFQYFSKENELMQNRWNMQSEHKSMAELKHGVRMTKSNVDFFSISENVSFFLKLSAEKCRICKAMCNLFDKFMWFKRPINDQVYQHTLCIPKHIFFLSVKETIYRINKACC